MTGHVAPLLSRSFDRATVTEVRHTVARRAGEAGLAGRRLQDFVLAVHEIITNAVRHAGGSGQVTLWSANGSVHCEVSDGGPGFADGRVNGFHLPPALALGGRGIWLARHLCDTLSVSTGPGGTTVRLATALG